MQLNKKLTYAIVGASNNPQKYGYIVMNNLQQAGFKLVPINLQEKMILGQKVYASLSEYPRKIGAVIFVVPPKIALAVLPEVKQLAINKVWFQPGSESQEALDFCLANEIEAVSHACVMKSY